jgi:hypothetical protein
VRLTTGGRRGAGSCGRARARRHAVPTRACRSRASGDRASVLERSGYEDRREARRSSARAAAASSALLASRRDVRRGAARRSRVQFTEREPHALCPVRQRLCDLAIRRRPDRRRSIASPSTRMLRAPPRAAHLRMCAPAPGAAPWLRSRSRCHPDREGVQVLRASRVPTISCSPSATGRAAVGCIVACGFMASRRVDGAAPELRSRIAVQDGWPIRPLVPHQRPATLLVGFPAGRLPLSRASSKCRLRRMRGRLAAARRSPPEAASAGERQADSASRGSPSARVNDARRAAGAAAPGMRGGRAGQTVRTRAAAEARAGTSSPVSPRTTRSAIRRRRSRAPVGPPWPRGWVGRPSQSLISATHIAVGELLADASRCPSSLTRSLRPSSPTRCSIRSRSGRVAEPAAPSARSRVARRVERRQVGLGGASRAVQPSTSRSPGARRRARAGGGRRRCGSRAGRRACPV